MKITGRGGKRNIIVYLSVLYHCVVVLCYFAVHLSGHSASLCGGFVSLCGCFASLQLFESQSLYNLLTMAGGTRGGQSESRRVSAALGNAALAPPLDNFRSLVNVV